MGMIVALLLTAAAVAYVVYPLLSPVSTRRPELLAVAADRYVIDGVAYASEEEWAIDRALDKAGERDPQSLAEEWQAECEDEVEQQVAAIREQRKPKRARAKRAVCLQCGKPFQPGDRFCPRCGAPHPQLCPRCGERHSAGDRYCARCGAALVKEGGQ